MSFTKRCEACFGRGYRGGGKLSVCRTCNGRGERTYLKMANYKAHASYWLRHWKRKAEEQKREQA